LGKNHVRAIREASRVESREFSSPDPRHVAQTSFESCDVTFAQSPGDSSVFTAKITFARFETRLASNLENFRNPIGDVSHRLPLKVVMPLFRNPRATRPFSWRKPRQRFATCLASNLENFQDPIRHMSHRLPLKVVTSLLRNSLAERLFFVKMMFARFETCPASNVENVRGSIRGMSRRLPLEVMTPLFRNPRATSLFSEQKSRSRAWRRVSRRISRTSKIKPQSDTCRTDFL
jgi:hypothetical protein